MALDTYFFEPILIKTTLGEIAVAPVTLGRLPALARAVAPFVGDLPGDDAPEAWLRLIADHGAAVIEALAVVTQREPREIETLPLDQAAHLATACVMVNLDFFAQRALPAITAAVARARTLPATAGMP